MPHHARTAAWTSTATRRWMASCDVCRTWRLVADYFEAYAPFGTGGGWWWSCGGCLLDVVEELRVAVTEAAAGVTEADQCWHQQSWDAGEYDGDFHPGECFGLAICDDPCRLCLLTRVVEPDHDPDWDALPSPCTEHGMESCPCEEGAQYPPHDAASERLGECRACRDDQLYEENLAGLQRGLSALRCPADAKLLAEHMGRVRRAREEAAREQESQLRDLNDDDHKMLDWMEGYLRCQTREARHFYLHRTDCEHDCKAFSLPESHMHTHNGWTLCFDYAHCVGCHCHLQDESHTACCTGEAAKQMYRERLAFKWNKLDVTLAAIHTNTPVDTPEKASAAAQAHMEGMRPLPGQALRHGAPCFTNVFGITHVIGTAPACSSCVRYRNHLGISFEEAIAIRAEGLHEAEDPDHSCAACAWGRKPTA